MLRTQMLRTTLLLGLGLFVVVRLAGAQTSPADSYLLAYYNAGATAPLQQSDSFLASAATCNQTPPTLTTSNPAEAVWNDLLNQGKVCIYVFPPTASILSFPIGNFEATLRAVNAIGTSAESNRAPFTRGTLPAVPSGFKVGR